MVRFIFSFLFFLSLVRNNQIGEIVGGYFAHSLAIMTDAAHLATDVGALLLRYIQNRPSFPSPQIVQSISLFAMWLSERPKTKSMSFGFHRAEILGAVLSVLLIWALTGSFDKEERSSDFHLMDVGVLIYEAINRIIHPSEHIHGDLMTLIAAIGLVISTFKDHRSESIERSLIRHSTDIADAIILGFGGAGHGHSHGGGDDHGHSHGGDGEVR